MRDPCVFDPYVCERVRDRESESERETLVVRDPCVCDPCACVCVRERERETLVVRDPCVWRCWVGPWLAVTRALSTRFVGENPKP